MANKTIHDQVGGNGSVCRGFASNHPPFFYLLERRIAFFDADPQCMKTNSTSKVMDDLKDPISIPTNSPSSIKMGISVL